MASEAFAFWGTHFRRAVKSSLINCQRGWEVDDVGQREGRSGKVDCISSTRILGHINGGQ